MQSKGKSTRRHSPESKQQVISACAQPGSSVAGVSLSFGLNDNLMHQWRRGRGIGIGTAIKGPEVAPSGFVALTLPASTVPEPVTVTAAAEAIRIEVERGSMSVKVAWPIGAPTRCVSWSRELLQ
jgi:transposase